MFFSIFHPCVSAGAMFRAKRVSTCIYGTTYGRYTFCIIIIYENPLFNMLVWGSLRLVPIIVFLGLKLGERKRNFSCMMEVQKTGEARKFFRSNMLTVGVLATASSLSFSRFKQPWCVLTNPGLKMELTRYFEFTPLEFMNNTNVVLNTERTFAQVHSSTIYPHSQQDGNASSLPD